MISSAAPPKLYHHWNGKVFLKIFQQAHAILWDGAINQMAIMNQNWGEPDIVVSNKGSLRKLKF